MGQVAITINGNNYQIACDEGQEERLKRLGAYVDERTAELVKSVGNVGDVRLMVMASLLVTAKLFDVTPETEKLRAEVAQTKHNPAHATHQAHPTRRDNVEDDSQSRDGMDPASRVRHTQWRG